MQEQNPNIIISLKTPTGTQYYKATSISSENEGFTITYKTKKNIKEKLLNIDKTDFVYAPLDYKFFPLNGIRYIGKIEGNNSACPYVKGEYFGTPYWIDCPSGNLSALINNNALTRAHNSLYSKKGIPWLIILIILIVVAIAIFGFMQLKQTPNNNNNIQVTPIEQKK